MKKFTAVFLTMCLSFLTLFGCGKAKEEADGAFYIYYQEQAERTLYPVRADVDLSMSMDLLVSSIWQKMSDVSDGHGYITLVPEAVSLLSYDFSENELILNFSEGYQEMTVPTEVLFRAGVVRTFSQIPDVSGIRFMVAGADLLLPDGTLAGVMRSQDYVDVIGSGLNAYTESDIVLYFADESGTSLIPVTRHIRYPNSYTLEKSIARALVEGPEGEEEAWRTLPGDLQVFSVRSQNGVCYISFSSELVNEELPVPPEIAVYSVVNSLTEVSGIKAVQLSVNGETNIILMNEISLDQPLQRDLNYVIQ